MQSIYTPATVTIESTASNGPSVEKKIYTNVDLSNSEDMFYSWKRGNVDFKNNAKDFGPVNAKTFIGGHH